MTILQAFLQDRRQTMRMHQPLRPRVVTDDNVGNSSFLPPLDGASRSNFSTINSVSSFFYFYYLQYCILEFLRMLLPSVCMCMYYIY